MNLNYTLLDGAVWQEDMEIARLYNASYHSLFRGSSAENWNEVAPYLFCCASDTEEFNEWVENKEQESPLERRVMRLTSSLDLDGLRKHLRRFLRVKNEDRKWLFFRFYDPFVMMDAFPHLTAEQQTEFMSQIASIQWTNPITKEVENIENTSFGDGEQKPEPHSHINDAWVMTNEQLENIGRSAFARQTTMQIQEDGLSEMEPKALLSFVREKHAQVLNYGFDRTDAVYDYILLSLKYNVLQSLRLSKDIETVLKDDGREQSQRIVDLQTLLIKNYSI
jgi:hypothetical protein